MFQIVTTFRPQYFTR